MEDHFSIIVNMIQESELKLAQEKISKGMTVADKLISNVPVIGSAGSTAIGIIGEIINLIVALSPENALVSEGNTYIIDETRYPDIIDKKRYPNSGLDYLRLGTFDFYEDGYYYKDGKYYKDGTDQEANPTRLTMELIRPVSKKPAPA
jgi:hypothetical protein